MSAKNSVTVVIAGKVTRLSGYESEEYLQRVASYLNHKISEEIYDLKQKIVELQMDLEELTAPSQERPAGRGKK